MRLENLGWTSFHSQAFERQPQDGCVPARVVFDSAGIFRIAGEGGERTAELAGRHFGPSGGCDERPVCGDWVVAEWPRVDGIALIRDVLPRRSRFVRKAAGSGFERQVLAANIDTVFVVAALDGELNLRRIERYLAVAWESGARPVVILNKTDLLADPEPAIASVRRSAPGVTVAAVSAATGHGVELLRPHLAPGCTVALLGSSGVGKSSLVNRLLGGDVQSTREVFERTGRGRHTTTARQMFGTPFGGFILDTPGLRELQVWVIDDGLDLAFAEIGELASGCRFRDCRHESEPGCAVRGALERGEVDPRRMESYEKLRRESEWVELRGRCGAGGAEKARWKKVATQARLMRLRSKSRQSMDG